jgi:hypothetical protein
MHTPALSKLPEEASARAVLDENFALGGKDRNENSFEAPVLRGKTQVGFVIAFVVAVSTCAAPCAYIKNTRESTSRTRGQ